MEGQGTVHRTIALLDGALRTLGSDPEEALVERLGVMVNLAMSAQARSFHTPEHIFDLADPTDPHLTLAALFHDLVYYQVDQGMPTAIGATLDAYVVEDQGSVHLATDIPEDDRAFARTAAIFGFGPGDKLSPFGGLNEFLSALVMNLLLDPVVDEPDLVVATAAIEQTIPFRGADDKGASPPEQLARRLGETIAELGIAVPRDIQPAVVVQAVLLANRDVRNFAEEDAARFLDNTWKLLPESNPALQFGGLYTIERYAQALYKMHGFLSALKPETIFHRFADQPDEDEYRSLLARAKHNLAIGTRYLGMKLVSAGLLHALAQLSGGDAPVAYFMGDLQPKGPGGQLSDHLPATSPEGVRTADSDDELFRLLAHGRASESRFDLQHSPLSLFIYRSVDDAGLAEAVANARRLLRGEIEADGYLRILPAPVVRGVATAVGTIAFTRRRRLSTALDEILRNAQ